MSKTPQTKAQRLSEYDVTVIFDASSSVTVKAASPEDAAHKAEELTNGNQILCHQCSDTLETGDAIGALVYKDGEFILDTSFQAMRIALLEAKVLNVEAERDQLRAQLAKAVAEEREACAKVAQDYSCQVGDAAWECAAAIRARSNT